MSHRNSMGAPTPRRSSRISEKAVSVVAESAVTTFTNGGTKVRRKGPLTKVKARKSNAYGASGRVGAAEDLAVTATGFAQAFQDQRGGAFVRDDDDLEEEADDDVDAPFMSGALNGHTPHRSPSPAFDVNQTREPGMSFLENESLRTSDDDLAASIGDTSKSFGPRHEAGMFSSLSLHGLRSTRMSPTPYENITPVPESMHASLLKKPYLQSASNLQARAQPKIPAPAPMLKPLTPVRPSGLVAPTAAAAAPAGPVSQATSIHVSPADRRNIELQIDELIAQERTRLQKDDTPQSERRSQPRRRHQPEMIPIDEWLRNVETTQKDEPENRWRRPLLYLFWTIMAFGVGAWMLSSALTSEYPESTLRMPKLFPSVGSRINYGLVKLSRFIQPPGYPPYFCTDEQEFGEFKAGHDDVMWGRMARIDKQYTEKFRAICDTIEAFKEKLPDYLVLKEHTDGHREITDDFWQALMDKARSKEENPDWINFLKKQASNIGTMSGVPRDGRAKSWDQIVSRGEFAAAIDAHYQKISTHVDARIKEMLRDDKAKRPNEFRLSALAETQMIVNHQSRLRNINYFSPALGATIVPSFTSSTYLQDRSLLTTFARKLSVIPGRNPPRAALDDWKEPGDCWCSTPSQDGQLQLAVALGRPMIPESATIEHIPRAMVPMHNIANAPRRLEFWAETSGLREDLEAECGQGLPGWSCLGSFDYRIDGPNHVQFFEFSRKLLVPVTRVIVRVSSNWGADHTCLYHVRLNGVDAEDEWVPRVGLGDP